jgi:hypothetical protein
MENNFKKILEAHTRKMMEAKRIYWKNRAKIRWAQLGDENTKFFHTIATQSFRKNLISSLTAQDGSIVNNHDHKAAIIWKSFKERLGVSDYTIMHFNLNEMIQSHDLRHLDEPFSDNEIEMIIKEMPSDRAPGPDGFNGAFLKKCWPKIKDEFKRLEVINTAHIMELSI